MRCESCGSEVVHMRGATGRISICTRCGWGKVELTKRRTNLAAAGQDDSADVGQKGWRAKVCSL